MAQGESVLCGATGLSCLPSRLHGASEAVGDCRHDRVQLHSGDVAPFLVAGLGGARANPSPIPPFESLLCFFLSARLARGHAARCGDHRWPQSAGLASSLLAACVMFSDTGSSLCPFLLQPERTGGAASVQAVIEKLREENRLLRQKVTHVSTCLISFNRRGGSYPLAAQGLCPPQATWADTKSPET